MEAFCRLNGSRSRDVKTFLVDKMNETDTKHNAHINDYIAFHVAVYRPELIEISSCGCPFH